MRTQHHTAVRLTPWFIGLLILCLFSSCDTSGEEGLGEGRFRVQVSGGIEEILEGLAVFSDSSYAWNPDEPWVSLRLGTGTVLSFDGSVPDSLGLMLDRSWESGVFFALPSSEAMTSRPCRVEACAGSVVLHVTAFGGLGQAPLFYDAEVESFELTEVSPARIAGSFRLTGTPSLTFLNPEPISVSGTFIALRSD